MNIEHEGKYLFYREIKITTSRILRNSACCYFRQKIRLVFIRKPIKIDKSAEKL